MKLKKDDQVVIIAGKDKGKKGQITKTIIKKDLIVVEGVNMRTKHIKKTPQKAGEKVTYEAPIHVSNAMLISPADNKPTRIGYVKEKGEKKYRICKRTKQSIDKK